MRSLRRLAPLTPELRHPSADFIAHRQVLLFREVRILLEYLWLIFIEYILELSQLSPRVSVLHAHHLVGEYLVVSCELAPLDLTDQNTWMVLSEKATVRALDPILVRVQMEDHWLLLHAKLKTKEGRVVSDFVAILAKTTMQEELVSLMIIDEEVVNVKLQALPCWFHSYITHSVATPSYE